MLMELQTLVENRSTLRDLKLLADDVDQWASVLAQSNPADGERTEEVLVGASECSIRVPVKDQGSKYSFS